MEMHKPPINHVDVETRPIAAEALAPRLPTMAASMYCIAMELSSAKIAGMLSAITCIICSFQRLPSMFEILLIDTEPKPHFIVDFFQVT